MIRKLFAAVAMTALMAGASLAADVKPAVVYDLGGRNDKSFNESAFMGAEKFKADTGIAYQDFEIQNDSQREQAMRKFAERGFSPIVAIGFSHAASGEEGCGGIPQHAFRHHRHGRRSAQCCLHRVQGT